MSMKARCSTDALRLWLALVWVSVVAAHVSFAQGLGSNLQYFAQVAMGGGAVTVFAVHNPTTAAVTVQIEVFSSQGVLLRNRAASVSAGGTSMESLGSPSDPLEVGWARLASAGRFSATAFYQIRVGQEDLPRVGVLPSVPAKATRLFAFMKKGETKTGIALANPSETQSATLTIRRYDKTGTPASTVTANLSPRNHLARFLDEEPLFPGLDDFEGIVEVESDQPVVAVMMRSDQNLLSTAAVLTPTLNQLTSGSVTTEFLANEAVTGDKIANGVITKEKLATGQVVTSVNGLKDDIELVAGSNVTITPSGQTLNIAATGVGGLTEVSHDATLTGSGTAASPLGLADGMVGTSKLSGKGVTQEKIGDNAVGSAQIIDSSVGPQDLATGAVRKETIDASGGNAGDALRWNGTNLVWQPVPGGCCDCPNDPANTTNLLFPIVSSAGGLNTLISIANTGLDPFGTPGGIGRCHFHFYRWAMQVGQHTSDSLTLGTSLSVDVYYGGASVPAMPNFSGYVIVRCDFAYAHGWAMLGDLTFSKIAATVPAVRICSTRRVY